VVGIALAITVISVPIAAVLGIPANALLSVLIGPLQTIILIVALVSAPAFLLAAWLAQLLGPLVNHSLQGFTLPTLNIVRSQPGSDLPLIILSVIVGSLFLFEFVVMGILLWFVIRDRARRQDMVDPAFEERATVVPAPGTAPAASPPPPPPATIDPNDPAGAYLVALDALADDGRWPRRPEETPAMHLARVRTGGMHSRTFGRLAAAYQLARYARPHITARETSRTPSRLAAFRAWLRGD
jgi:hypothetical protein